MGQVGDLGSFFSCGSSRRSRLCCWRGGGWGFLGWFFLDIGDGPFCLTDNFLIDEQVVDGPRRLSAVCQPVLDAISFQVSGIGMRIMRADQLQIVAFRVLGFF